MAEEPKKEKRSDKRYGKSPRIEEKAKEGGERRSDGPMDGDVKVTHTKPQTEAGGKPKADVGSGTEGVPVADKKTEQPKGYEDRSVDGVGRQGEMHMTGRHAMERHEQHHRQMREHSDMHMRHELEHRMHDK